VVFPWCDMVVQVQANHHSVGHVCWSTNKPWCGTSMCKWKQNMIMCHGNLWDVYLHVQGKTRHRSVRLAPACARTTQNKRGQDRTRQDTTKQETVAHGGKCRCRCMTKHDIMAPQCGRKQNLYV
jgi:translation initiation factor IF-1